MAQKRRVFYTTMAQNPRSILQNTPIAAVPAGGRDGQGTGIVQDDRLSLGKTTDFPDRYDASLLFAIDRAASRTTLGEPLPFSGVDIWRAWELTWLRPGGRPCVATAEILVPAASPRLVESKSLKLYLNSFAMSEFDGFDAVARTIGRDLSALLGAEVTARVESSAATLAVDTLPGACIDDLDTQCEHWEVAPALLRADAGDVVAETLHSHLLRSLCPVTAQPDIGSVLIDYRGPRIDRAGLLRYIVSFRRHQDFHEACVERMFCDLLERSEPESLTVQAFYTRRGGIDINPFRTNCGATPAGLRLWRQ